MRCDSRRLVAAVTEQTSEDTVPRVRCGTQSRVDVPVAFSASMTRAELGMRQLAELASTAVTHFPCVNNSDVTTSHVADKIILMRCD